MKYQAVLALFLASTSAIKVDAAWGNSDDRLAAVLGALAGGNGGYNQQQNQQQNCG